MRKPAGVDVRSDRDDGRINRSGRTEVEKCPQVRSRTRDEDDDSEHSASLPRARHGDSGERNDERSRENLGAEERGDGDRVDTELDESAGAD